MKKKLYRSRQDRILGGVLGGLAEYSDSDVIVWRLLFVALVLFTGVFPGIIFYLLALLIIPNEPTGGKVREAETKD